MSPRERESLRTCLGCRRQLPRQELIRIVRGPDGAACFDLDGRLPGRGAWVCPSPSCVDAIAAGALAHVLRAPVRLEDASARRRGLADALRRRMANLLTMSRRTGGVVIGPTGVRVALAQGRAALVLLAGDIAQGAAADWAARSAPGAVRTAMDSDELGALFGRGPVEVAAITVPGLAAAVARAADRWRTFCAVSCDNEKLPMTGHRGRRARPARREEAERQ